MKPYRRSLFLFERDLRIQDNAALHRACRESETVYPCFFVSMLDIASAEKKNAHALAFVASSVHELSEDIHQKGGALSIFTGSFERHISRILKAQKINAIFINARYTPLFKKQITRIRHICKLHGCACIICDDALLYPPGSVLTEQETPYLVYSAFARKALRKAPPKPLKSSLSTLSKHRLPKSISTKALTDIYSVRSSLRYHGGRREGLKYLKKISDLKSYAKDRDFVALDRTSHLSAHHAFGTISIRETYWAIRGAFGPSHQLIKELLWRDFFTHIAFFHPHVFRKAFYSKYDRLRWNSRPSAFKAWQEGKTGVPIVDAGMRQLKKTGFLPNRVRMIVASFLIKDLRIDWRKGERYFARTLIDEDPSVNNGNWQWVASTGCDAQPYLRIFNPWTQQKRFDPKAEYIRAWIPELAEVELKTIHRWDEVSKKESKTYHYPLPIVDHQKERQKTLAWYRHASKSRANP